MSVALLIIPAAHRRVRTTPQKCTSAAVVKYYWRIARLFPNPLPLPAFSAKVKVPARESWKQCLRTIRETGFVVKVGCGVREWLLWLLGVDSSKSLFKEPLQASSKSFFKPLERASSRSLFKEPLQRASSKRLFKESLQASSKSFFKPLQRASSNSLYKERLQRASSESVFKDPRHRAS